MPVNTGNVPGVYCACCNRFVSAAHIALRRGGRCVCEDCSARISEAARQCRERDLAHAGRDRYRRPKPQREYWPARRGMRAFTG